IAEKDACAFALGALKDSSSIPQLQALTKSSPNAVRLAAFRALNFLGVQSIKKEVEKLAEEGDIFAISTLAEIPQANDTLYTLLYNSDIEIKANAAIALLKQQDPRCARVLKDLLIPKESDLAILP